MHWVLEDKIFRNISKKVVEFLDKRKHIHLCTIKTFEVQIEKSD